MIPFRVLSGLCCILLLFRLSPVAASDTGTAESEITVRLTDLGKLENRVRIDFGSILFQVTDSRKMAPLLDGGAFHGTAMWSCTGPWFLLSPVTTGGYLRELFTPLSGSGFLQGTDSPVATVPGWCSIDGLFGGEILLASGHLGLLALCPRSLLSPAGEEVWQDSFLYPAVTGMVFACLGYRERSPAALDVALLVSDAPPTVTGSGYTELPFYYRAPEFPGGRLYHAVTAFSCSLEYASGEKSGETRSGRGARSGPGFSPALSCTAAVSMSAGTAPGFLVRGFGELEAGVFELRLGAGRVSESFLTPEGVYPDESESVSAGIAAVFPGSISIAQTLEKRVLRPYPVPGLFLETREYWTGKLEVPNRLHGTSAETVFGAEYSLDFFWMPDGEASRRFRVRPFLKRVSGDLRTAMTAGCVWETDSPPVWKLACTAGALLSDPGRKRAGTLRAGGGFSLSGEEQAALGGFLRLEWRNPRLSGSLRIGTKKPVPLDGFRDLEEGWRSVPGEYLSVRLEFRASADLAVRSAGREEAIRAETLPESGETVGDETLEEEVFRDA